MAGQVDPFASNPFGVTVSEIDWQDESAPYAMTYHGLTIVANDYIVGRITSWNPAELARENALIYELSYYTFGRPVDQVGAHVKGHNRTTVGVCYIGGLRDRKPVDTMTPEQEVTFLELVYSLRKSLGYLTVHGHNEYSAKACPSFVVKEKYPFLNSGHEEQT